MTIKDYLAPDFVNYKLPSFYIIMPYCTFKCGKEFCQNSKLSNESNINISSDKLISLFDNSLLSEAVVFGGLEPFDSSDELQDFISKFRASHHTQPIVIYTGYTEEEVRNQFFWIFTYDNIIIKYGRYISNQTPHFDELLGVELASDNQYAVGYNLRSNI